MNLVILLPFCGCILGYYSQKSLIKLSILHRFRKAYLQTIGLQDGNGEIHEAQFKSIAGGRGGGANRIHLFEFGFDTLHSRFPIQSVLFSVWPHAIVLNTPGNPYRALFPNVSCHLTYKLHFAASHNPNLTHTVACMSVITLLVTLLDLPTPSDVPL